MAIVEPGSTWISEIPATTLKDNVLHGEKVSIEQLDLSDQLIVSAAVEGEPGLVVIAADDPGLVAEPRPSFDPALPMFAARLADARATRGGGRVVHSLG